MQAARPGYGHELRRALLRLSETIDDPGSDRYMREHTAFHWALIEPAVGPVMRRVVEQRWQMSERYIRLTVASPERGARTRSIMSRWWTRWNPGTPGGCGPRWSGT
jgi:DNA-binding GntR family transcriptional regulator